MDFKISEKSGRMKRDYDYCLLYTFQVMKESVKWGDIQEIETVGGLNRNITSGDVQETVLVQEAMQERRIAEIAQMIASRPEIRFVLIAGPSSSGKTTFSHRLSVQLRANGMRPVSYTHLDVYKRQSLHRSTEL